MTTPPSLCCDRRKLDLSLTYLFPPKPPIVLDLSLGYFNFFASVLNEQAPRINHITDEACFVRLIRPQLTVVATQFVMVTCVLRVRHQVKD